VKFSFWGFKKKTGEVYERGLRSEGPVTQRRLVGGPRLARQKNSRRQCKPLERRKKKRVPGGIAKAGEKIVAGRWFEKEKKKRSSSERRKKPLKRKGKKIWGRHGRLAGGMPEKQKGKETGGEQRSSLVL